MKITGPKTGTVTPRTIMDPNNPGKPKKLVAPKKHTSGQQMPVAKKSSPAVARKTALKALWNPSKVMGGKKTPMAKMQPTIKKV